MEIYPMITMFIHQDKDIVDFKIVLSLPIIFNYNCGNIIFL